MNNATWSCVGYFLVSLFNFTISLQTHSQHLCHHLPGSDGVFDINSTSGCITLTTYPSLLKNELYEIKVKVSVIPLC